MMVWHSVSTRRVYGGRSPTVLSINASPIRICGYSVLVVYFALIGHGLGNYAYKELISSQFDTGVLMLSNSDEMLLQNSDMSEAVFAGAFSGYCSAYVNANFNTRMFRNADVAVPLF